MREFYFGLALGVAVPITAKLLTHLLSAIQQFFTLGRKRVLFGWFRRRTTCLYCQRNGAEEQTMGGS